jgi:type IV pilus assembly protein PilY1
MYIGTGRYLGNSDLSDPGAASGIAWQQTLYGFKDKNVDYGTNLRTGATLVTQTLTKVGSTSDRAISSNPVDWNTKDGWLVDFNPPADPSPGEEVNLDPRLVLGTVKVITNIPSGGGACAIGGSSIDYDFDFRTGSSIATATGGVVGRSLGGTIAVGMAIIQLPSGAIKDIITGADTSKTTVDVQINAAGAGVKRFSYRER